MIAHISGTIAEKFGQSVIVDVNGVGYELILTALDAEEITLGDSAKFYTYHSIRENSEELFGFSSLEAKRLFELLISVQGIGPKAAISILSLAAPEEVRNAIANADVAFVSKAVGVGKRSAERIIVDLKEKVGVPSRYGATAVSSVAAKPQKDDALDALMALGFSLKEASEALAEVDPGLPLEERIKLALKR